MNAIIKPTNIEQGKVLTLQSLREKKETLSRKQKKVERRPCPENKKEEQRKHQSGVNP